MRKKCKKCDRLILGMFLFIIVLLFIILCQAIKYELMKEEFGEFLIFTVNVSSHCAEINNMTYNELIGSYLREYSEELILEGFGE